MSEEKKNKKNKVETLIWLVGYRLWRRARLHCGGCEESMTWHGDDDSIPSVLSKKCLSLSENFGLGIPAAKDLNNGVT